MSQAIWTLAWPILIESVLNSTVGLVDTTLASHISKAAADGVAAGAYIYWFVGLITTAIGVGATALISRSIGAGHKGVANGALGQAMMLAATLGSLTGIGLIVLAPALATMFKLNAQASHDFVVFLRAIGVATPFSTVMFAGIACARGAGDTLRPLWSMVWVNVVNIILSLTLIKVFKLGTLGIGIGTLCAHIVGCAIVVRFHLIGRSGIKLKRQWLSWHPITLRRLVRLGLPNFFEMFGMYIGNMLVVLMVSSLNSAHVASDTVSEDGGLLGAHLIAIRIESFSFLPGFSMGIAAGALAGQYLGAGAPGMARRAIWRCAAIGAGLMGIGGLVFLTLGSKLVAIVSAQPEHVELVPKLLFITGCVQVPFAIAIILRSSLHGAGDVRAVMVMTWISTWGLRLPLAFIISGADVQLAGVTIHNPGWFKLGLPGIWYGLCAEIVLRCLIYLTRFLGGQWMKGRV